MSLSNSTSSVSSEFFKPFLASLNTNCSSHELHSLWPDTKATNHFSKVLKIDNTQADRDVEQWERSGVHLTKLGDGFVSSETYTCSVTQWHTSDLPEKWKPLTTHSLELKTCMATNSQKWATTQSPSASKYRNWIVSTRHKIIQQQKGTSYRWTQHHKRICKDQAVKNRQCLPLVTEIKAVAGRGLSNYRRCKGILTCRVMEIYHHLVRVTWRDIGLSKLKEQYTWNRCVSM